MRPELPDQTLLKSRPVELPCTVYYSPVGEYLWNKDGKQLRNLTLYNITSSVTSGRVEPAVSKLTINFKSGAEVVSEFTINCTKSEKEKSCFAEYQCVAVDEMLSLRFSSKAVVQVVIGKCVGHQE